MMIISSLNSMKPERAAKTLIIDVPELGDGAQLIIKEFSAISAVEFNEKMFLDGLINNNSGNVSGIKFLKFMCLLIANSVVNENGELIIGADNSDWISDNWNYELINKVYTEAAKINGFMGGEVDAEKK